MMHRSPVWESRGVSGMSCLEYCLVVNCFATTDGYQVMKYGYDGFSYHRTSLDMPKEGVVFNYIVFEFPLVTNLCTICSQRGSQPQSSLPPLLATRVQHPDGWCGEGGSSRKCIVMRAWPEMMWSVLGSNEFSRTCIFLFCGLTSSDVLLIRCWLEV